MKNLFGNDMEKKIEETKRILKKAGASEEALSLVEEFIISSKSSYLRLKTFKGFLKQELDKASCVEKFDVNKYILIKRQIHETVNALSLKISEKMAELLSKLNYEDRLILVKITNHSSK